MSGRGPLGFDDDGTHDPDPLPGRELESLAAPPPPPSREPAGASRYGWFVGIALVLLLALVTLNSLRTESRGARGVEVGERLPPFAVPLARSTLEGDANVARRPEQGQAGRRPACEVRGPEILNVCELAERGPVALAFLATRGGDCADALDRLERVARRVGGVQVAAVAIRGDRDDVRDLVRRRGWSFPVGYDRDGVLANLYNVAVCPQVTFAERGGRVVATSFGDAGEEELERRLRALSSPDAA